MVVFPSETKNKLQEGWSIYNLWFKKMPYFMLHCIDIVRKAYFVLCGYICQAWGVCFVSFSKYQHSALYRHLQCVRPSSRRRCEKPTRRVEPFWMRAAPVWLEEVIHQQRKMAEVIELQKLKVGTYKICIVWCKLARFGGRKYVVSDVSCDLKKRVRG